MQIQQALFAVFLIPLAFVTSHLIHLCLFTFIHKYLYSFNKFLQETSSGMKKEEELNNCVFFSDTLI